MPTVRPTSRSAPPATSTIACYIAYALIGWILSGMGAVLPDLRDELGPVAGLYPSLPGIGLVVLGLAEPGRSLAARRPPRRPRPLGVRQLVTGGSLAVSAGLTVMVMAPWPAVSLVGAVILGFGSAAMIRLIPAALAARDPDRSMAVLTRGNAWSSVASISGPLAIGAATWIGLGWRAGLLAAPAATILALAALTRVGDEPAPGTTTDDLDSPAGPDRSATAAPSPTGAGAGPTAPPTPGWLWAWLTLTLSIVVEFAFVYFAATYLREEVGMSPAASAAGAAAFAIGMTIGRFGAGAVPWFASRALLFHLALLGGGFALMWALPTPATAVAGLAVAGLGTALLYPLGIDRLLRCFPAAPSVGASRGGLASGIALLASPALLGLLRAQVGLRAAYLAVPALLAAIAAADRARRRADFAASAAAAHSS